MACALGGIVSAPIHAYSDAEVITHVARTNKLTCFIVHASLADKFKSAAGCPVHVFGELHDPAASATADAAAPTDPFPLTESRNPKGGDVRSRTLTPAGSAPVFLFLFLFLFLSIRAVRVTGNMLHAVAWITREGKLTPPPPGPRAHTHTHTHTPCRTPL